MAEVSTFEPIQSITLSTNSTTVTFSSVPNTYTDLVLHYQMGGNSANNIQIRYNGDTASNYSATILYAYNGTATAGGNYQNLTFGYGGSGAISGPIGNIGANGIIEIYDYKDTNKFKTSISHYAYVNTSSTAELTRFISTWRSTAAISSIQLSSYSGPYLANSIFTLYGIKAG